LTPSASNSSFGFAETSGVCADFAALQRKRAGRSCLCGFAETSGSVKPAVLRRNAQRCFVCRLGGCTFCDGYEEQLPLSASQPAWRPRFVYGERAVSPREVEAGESLRVRTSPS